MPLPAADKIPVYGHRGARALLPENTLPGFKYTAGVGADWIEFDTQVTSDGVLVISHDAHLNRAICQGPEGENAIRKLTFAQVREWDCGALKNKDFPRQQPVPGTKVPTLDEVLDLALSTRLNFLLEIKTEPRNPDLQPEPDEYVRMVLAKIRERKLEPRTIIESFDFRIVQALGRQAPDIRRAALFSSTDKTFAEVAADAGGAPIVAPHFSAITPERVKAAHAAGLQVVAWTANDAATWDRLIAAAVDGIISDDPAALIEHLKAKALR